MRLSIAFLCTLFVSSSAMSAPLPKDPPKGMPHLVVQIKPIDNLLGDIKYVHEKLSKESGVVDLPKFDEILTSIEDFLPGWKTAIDTSKAWGAYANIPSDPEKTRLVVLLPVKNEKAFLDYVENNFGGWMQEKDLGYYQFDFPFILSKLKACFRFKNGYAYVTFVDPSAIEDVKTLPIPMDLMLKDETALIAARLYIEGLPDGVRKTVHTWLDELARTERAEVPVMLLMGLIGASDVKNLAERLKQLIDEGKWAALRLEFDRRTDELGLEFNLVPRKDSALGREIAAYTPRKSRVAGLLDEQNVIGFSWTMGNFGGLKIDPMDVQTEIRDFLKSIGLSDDIKEVTPLIGTLLNAIRVKEVDVALALKQAPGKKTYTLVMGARLNQPKILGLALLDYVKALPKEQRDLFKPYAMKLDGDIAVHKFSLASLPEEIRALLGDGDLWFMIQDDFLFAAAGGEAIDRLKECLQLKPQPGPFFRLEAHPAKMKLLALLMGGDEGVEQWGKLFPKDDKVRILDAKVEGGAVLRVRYGIDLMPVLKAVLYVSKLK